VLELRLVQPLIRDGETRTIKDGEEKSCDAWLPVLGSDGKPKVFEAPHDDKAIEQHTGKGEGAKIGTWKAISARSWKGIVEVEPPAQVLEDRRKARDDL
jgi:hypothetical protein